MVIKKDRRISGTPEVKWIGARVDVPPHFAQKEVYFYEKCIFGPQLLCVGDYVLVSNADSAEPDTIAGCDVAKILQLYELREMTDRDPYRAIIQWYSRPKGLPHKEFDRDDICIDFDCEVIEDHRPYDGDISLEAIFRKCSVITGTPDDLAADLLKKFDLKRNCCPMFVCRYKFIRVKKTYRLVPLQFASEETVDEDSAKGAARREGCIRVTPALNSTSKSASARTPKRQAAFTGEKRRRASVTASGAVEFIDMNYFHSENKVSPIKIVGGRSVVRLSVSAKKQTTFSSGRAERNTNYLIASPLTEKNINVTPTSRAAAARRNLNLSLDKEVDSTTESDCLNYSIVNMSSDSHQPVNDMKIKLRLSERSRPKTRLVSREDCHETDPLAVERHAEKLSAVYPRKRVSAVSAIDNSTPNNTDIYHTPSKRSKEYSGSAQMTPSTRRKSILKSATRRLDDGTPRRSIQLSSIVERRVFQKDEIIATPTHGSAENPAKAQIEFEEEERTPPKKTVSQKPPSSGRRSAAKHSRAISPNTGMPKTPSQKLKLIRSGEISPTLKQRQASGVGERKSELQLAREQLHVSVVPKSMPCREREFENIYNFLVGKIEDKCGGCIYVSGVPGTGKTATVTSVIRMLQRQAAAEKLPPFDFLEINGMRLTEPRQAYVQIFKQLTGKTVSWEHAHSLLEKRFTTSAPRRVTTVLLVDELDILCNRRQDVVYNLLDWPTKSAARLVVVTIANTMDLPERLLMGKVTSRLGLTRLTFQPYTHKQLQDIVTARLSGSEAFKGDAIQLVARKVASVSGDARRALDICRRATEIADSVPSALEGTVALHQCTVNMTHVQQALAEMISSAKVQAIKNCSRLEQMFLQAVVAEATRTGVEETSFMGVYSQMETLAAFLGATVPTPGRALRICSKLGAERLLICEHSRNDIFQKILLNVSTDDVHFALRINSNNTS